MSAAPKFLHSVRFTIPVKWKKDLSPWVVTDCGWWTFTTSVGQITHQNIKKWLNTNWNLFFFSDLSLTSHFDAKIKKMHSMVCWYSVTSLFLVWQLLFFSLMLSYTWTKKKPNTFKKKVSSVTAVWLHIKMTTASCAHKHAVLLSCHSGALWCCGSRAVFMLWE